MSGSLVIQVERLAQSVVVSFVGLLDPLGILIRATRSQSRSIVPKYTFVVRGYPCGMFLVRRWGSVSL